MSFKASLVVPEQQTLSADAQQVILPAYDGMLGILADRAPMLAKLGTGPMRVDAADGRVIHILIEGGIAQMKDNELTVITQHATLATEIDAEAARADYVAAIAKRATTSQAIADKEQEVAKARAKIALAERVR